MSQSSPSRNGPSHFAATRRSLAWVLAVAILVVIPCLWAASGSALSPSERTGAARTPFSTADTGLATTGANRGPAVVVTSASTAALVERARAAMAAAGRLSEFYPPDIRVGPPAAETGGHVVPFFTNAPAPLGVATYGLENTTGVVRPYVLRTTSVMGTFTTGDPLGVQTTELYFPSLGDGGGIRNYSAQLNVVLMNATIQGARGYSFWLQNVFDYNTSTDTLSFVNNIWNLTSPAYNGLNFTGTQAAGSLPSSTFLSGLGADYSGLVYAVESPSMQVAYPFTVDVYLNTTVGSFNGSALVNEIYFNYSVFDASGRRVCPVSEPAGMTCGSYDNVYLNSSENVAPGSAEIEANGYHYLPCGLPEDMEMTEGIGSNDGTNSNIVYANASVGLYVWNATVGRYVAPPSAYNFGSDTAETATGADGTYSVGTNGVPTEHFRTGPALLGGLWNATGTTPNAGAYPLNVAGVAPGNAFVAVAPGAGVTNQSFFQLAPTFGWFSGRGSLGHDLWLAPGFYTVEVLLSGYNEVVQNVNLTSSAASLSVTLTRQAQPTVYTPMWAFSNSDLANLSVAGAGTAARPYVMPSDQPGPLSDVFATLNTYLFVVWSGIWLNGTTAHVVFEPPPSLTVKYPTWWYPLLDALSAPYPAGYGAIPYTQQLPMYFLDASNVTIANAPSIGGWTFNQVFFNYYALYIQGGHSDLLYRDYFNVSSEGADLFGGGGNTVWGSTFYPYVNPALPGLIPSATGLTVAESGDTIYNNAFYTNPTASSPAGFVDSWNASGGYQSASVQVVVNGFSLSGSILGQSIQGGNYWSNYGGALNPYGVPYVDMSAGPGFGQVGAGGAGAIGTEGATGIITPWIGSGADDAPLTVYTPVALAPAVPAALGVGLYPVLFNASGLSSGNNWTVELVGVPVYEPLTTVTYAANPFVNTTVPSGAVTSQVTLWAPNGTYGWVVVAEPNGTVATPTSGSITIFGTSVEQSLTFGPAPVPAPSWTYISTLAAGLISVLLLALGAVLFAWEMVRINAMPIPGVDNAGTPASASPSAGILAKGEGKEHG